MVNATQEEGRLHLQIDEAVATFACSGSNAFAASRDSDDSANQGGTEASSALPNNVTGSSPLVAVNGSVEEGDITPESHEMTPADEYNEMLETLIETNFFGRYSVSQDGYFNRLRRSVSTTSSEETVDTL